MSKNFTGCIDQHERIHGYSEGKSTLELSSRANEKYKYGYLGCWYIKLSLFKRL